MKRFLIVTLCVSALLYGCKTPEIVVLCACEDVTEPSDRPWIEELIKTTVEAGEPLEYIEKVSYRIGQSEETYVGFLVVWQEPGTADETMAVLLDCDGNRLATYRLDGCEGLCKAHVTSRLRIYEKEKSPQESCEWAIRGMWLVTNSEKREQLGFQWIRHTGSEGLLSYLVGTLEHDDGVQVDGYIKYMLYSVTPDSLTLKNKLFEYTTHYTIVQDTLLTIDRFSEDGKSFRKIELSLMNRPNY